MTSNTTDSSGGGVRRFEFGRMPGGEVIEAVEIANARGLRLRVISFGAAIQGLSVPDRHGHCDEVVLHYSELKPYLARPEFFGAVVGRYANRIGGGGFMLDGTRYDLVANEGPNVLHGGAHGLHHVVWAIDVVEAGDAPRVQLSYRSVDGEQGFPGDLCVRVSYTLTPDNALRVTFEATTNKPTVVSLTSHPYFNLGGARSGRDILDHSLQLAADTFMPIDEAMLPTGELRSVSDTPFDFREPQIIGGRVGRTEDAQVAHTRGFDHNFVLRGGVTTEPKLAARLADPKSGRILELFTTEPGLQFYTGQKLGTGEAETPAEYRACAGVALEPQFFPDSPNRPEFPSTRLDPGGTYRQVSIYGFSAEGD